MGGSSNTTSNSSNTSKGKKKKKTLNRSTSTTTPNTSTTTTPADTPSTSTSIYKLDMVIPTPYLLSTVPSSTSLLLDINDSQYDQQQHSQLPLYSTKLPKCRLPIPIMSKHKLSINQWIGIITHTGTIYYAKAYPSSLSSNSQQETDRIELRLTENVVQSYIPNALPSNNGLQENECRIIPISKIEKATKIAIYIQPLFDLTKPVNLAKRDMSSFASLQALYANVLSHQTEALRGFCGDLLNGTIISDRSEIVFPGCFKLLISKPLPTTSTPLSPLLITSSTIIKFRKSDPNAPPNDSNSLDALTSQLDQLNISPSQSELSQPPPPPPGLETPFQTLQELVLFPLQFPSKFRRLNLSPPKGVLLVGPSGTGKTSLLHYFITRFNIPLITIDCGQVFGDNTESGETILRNKFDQTRTILKRQPTNSSVKGCILFIDEIDTLMPSRDSSSVSTHQVRLVTQLLTLMDGMDARSENEGLVIVGATNRVNDVDAALRRPGRFDREVHFPIPNATTRKSLFEYFITKHGIHPQSLDLEYLSRATNGYVLTDFVSLFRQLFFTYGPEHVLNTLSMQNILETLTTIQPTLKRNTTTHLNTTEIDKSTTWSTIGGVSRIKSKLRSTIAHPILHPETFTRLGIKPSRGILLYGPPGCSKTSLVKCIVNEISSPSSSTNTDRIGSMGFYKLDGANLFSAYLGEAERLVRDTFQKSRQSRPSILFIDELDSIVGKRDLQGSGNSKSTDVVQERVLSTLLNEMDGIEGANGVLVIAATNRPDMIDEALLRPGRFDKILYVPPPDLEGRLEILEIKTRGMKVGSDVDLGILAKRTEFFTGADLENLCREAALIALREGRLCVEVLSMQYFEKALQVVKPSLSVEMLRQYEDLVQIMGEGVVGK